MLAQIQKQLAVPKGQFNDFGGFAYRSAEDILEAVKPLLPEGWYILISVFPVEVCEKVYQSCEVVLTNGTEEYHASASAREPESKKGMDASQLSGSTISYAKKYALGNLFAIDNEKDPDSMAPEETQSQIEKHEKETAVKYFALDYSMLKTTIRDWALATGKDLEEARQSKWDELGEGHTQKDINDMVFNLRKEIEVASMVEQVVAENPDIFEPNPNE